MTMRRRIAALESRHPARGLDMPTTIFLTSPDLGATVALLLGGCNLSREPDEPEADFIARAVAVASDADLMGVLGNRHEPRAALTAATLEALRRKHNRASQQRDNGR